MNLNQLNDFLKSLKADLSDRRVLPFVALSGLALVAALAYVALSGGGSKPQASSEAAVAAVRPAGTGIALTPAVPGPDAAVAETTDGAKLQRQGAARNPFTPLPFPALKAVATTASSGATSSVVKSAASSGGESSSKGGSASKESTSSGSSSPSTPSQPKPSAPAKPKNVYAVEVAIGPIAPGSIEPSTELKALPVLTKPTPLPSSHTKLLQFVGVTPSSKGYSANFAVLGEVILRGAGRCLPSAAQCLMLQLKEGASEQLEYIEASGSVSALELKVTKITRQQASAAAFARLMHAQRAAAAADAYGHQLATAGLRFGRAHAVIVFTARSSSHR
jgi:hypothetical protein